MVGAESIEQLRDYSPQARSLLIGNFEYSLLGGGEAVGTDLILQQLRGIAREQSESPRAGHCARLFFKPLEPFMVDDCADHHHPGKLSIEGARSSAA
jgi:hypothetical protein